MTNVTIQVNDLQKKKVEQVAAAYDCSQSAAGRLLFEQAYNELFGTIHPDALERHDVDTDALVSGDLEPEAIDDDLKLEGDEPASVPTTDGGTTQRVQPSSYTPTYTPQDLACSGPALEWDELKDAVDSHWGPELSIHPDRVDKDANTLRANVAVSAKIIAALIRAEHDEVSEQFVDAKILEYTEHQIRRADTEAGREYKTEQYRPYVLEQFIDHPDPTSDTYYTSPCAMERTLASEVADAIDQLEETQFVLDPQAHVQQTGTKVKEDPTEWLADLAAYRETLGLLHAVRNDERALDMLRDQEDELFPDAPNAMVGLREAFVPALEAYTTVNEYARFVVAHTILELEIGEGMDAEIEAGEIVTPDTPHDPLLDFVEGPDEPVRRQAQFERVVSEI